MIKQLSSSQRTQLFSDMIHAAVVIIVVVCVTLLAWVRTANLPIDVVGTVFGGAIGYAAGRAGNVRVPPEPPAGVKERRSTLTDD